MHGEAARQRNDTMMSSGGDAAKHKLPGNYKLTCVKQYKDGLRLKSKLRLVLPISMLLPCTCMSNSLCRSAIYITMLKLFHTTSGKWWLQVQQCQMMAARKRQPNRTHCVTQDPSVQCRLSFGRADPLEFWIQTKIQILQCVAAPLPLSRAVSSSGNQICGTCPSEHTSAAR